MHAAVKELIQKEGRLDALVNNAGYGLIGAEESVTIDEAQKLFDVNFFGSLRLIQAALPTMREQHFGHIINISSASGVGAFPGLGLYAASKFALEGLSESLAVTVSPWNIKVSLVEPGNLNNRWPEHCPVGSRLPDEPTYQALSKAIQTMLTKEALTAQSEQEVALLIVEIAETDDPHLRYPTSERIKHVLSRKLVDVTGDQMRDENIRGLNELLGK